MQVLYLASQSKSRQKLLTESDIPYKIISHESDECGIDASGSFSDYVLAIAQHKMKHIISPDLEEGSSIFVLTADTLSKTMKTGKILGKPKDVPEAKQMLLLCCQEPIELATACCLEKKEYKNKKWETVEKKYWVTKSSFEFCVDQEDVDLYLKKVPQALNACGAGIVENFGLNFLKQVKGSYSAIIGLPIYELRQALKKLGFFNHTD